ncbi:MAG: aminoacyl-tRNA hydrolase [bacterium]|nr:aminoacyl-tRNA hydrolase [bacterium]
MKIIVGLGNPGKEYENTRHNIGFKIADAFSNKHEFQMNPFAPTHKSATAEKDNNGEKIMIVKPMTFMNLSGPEIAARANFYKINIGQDLLIVYDDKDMAFGKLRERLEGSSGGHNGIKSIIEHLGTDQFHRLKFGIGHEDQSLPTDAFVLQDFSKEEQQQLPELIEQAVRKIEDWLK